MSVLIRLTQGMEAIVDDEWHWLDAWKWHAVKCGNVYYARHRERIPEGTMMVSMHRLIIGAVPGQKVDHRNGNGLDNRRENLRFCTDSQNFQNSRKRKGCSSRFKGVYWDKSAGKWRTQISFPYSGKSSHVGIYDDEIKAALAYNGMAKELYGEFARLNDVEAV